MKGVQIFAHSVRLVLNNLDMALRVSLLLYMVQVSTHVFTYLNPPQTQVFDGAEIPVMDPGTASMMFVLSIAAVVASLWIAVAWHRFVLAEERPEGWLPKWQGGRMLGYLGRSFLIAIFVVLAVMVAMIPTSVLLLAGGVGAILNFFVAAMVGSVVLFRLGVMLPARTIDRDMKLSEAWTATKGQTETIAVLALLSAGATLLIQIPTYVSGNPNSLLSLIYSIVVGWFITMVGISVLTTLYGHFVEGRPID